MTQQLLALISLLALYSAAAKDGGLVRTGSVSVSEQSDPVTGLSLVSRSTTTNLFDEHGDLAQSIHLSYFNGAGIPHEAITTHFFYDRRGNLLSSVQEVDFNGDGIPDEVITNHFFYGRHGLLLCIVADKDADADGTIDSTWTSNYTYDNKGREIGLVLLYDNNADGIADFRSVSSWTYDLKDHLLFGTNEDDFNSPGILEVGSTETSTLNDDAKPISSIRRSYDPYNGSQITWFTTYTYDKFGNLVQQTQQVVLPGPNGPITLTTTDTVFYSSRGQVVREVRSPPGPPAEDERSRMEEANRYESEEASRHESHELAVTEIRGNS